MVRVASFEYEADMCKTLSKQLAQLSRRIRVVRHLQVATDIPDYVITFTPESVGSVPRFSSLECAALAQLRRDGRASAPGVAKELFAQQSRIELALQRVVKLGHARREDGEFIPTSTALMSARTIAIEAKLTRWRDAVDQAVRYKRFSNASFVALPSEVVDARRASFERDCVADEIGLIAVSRGKFSIEVPAPFVENWSADWLWAVTRSLSAELSGIRRTSGRRRANCADGSSSFAR